MIDIDRMLQGFRPEKFRRENLRKRKWTLPGTQYFIQLDAYAAWLEERLAELRENIAKSEGNYYLLDAKEWTRQWNDLQRKLGEKEAEIRRLQLENEYLYDRLDAYEAAENPKSQRKRNSTTGQFVADMPKFDKMWKAHDMDRRGYKTAEISRALNISPETVKRYIRDYPAEWAKRQGIPLEEEEEA